MTKVDKSKFYELLSLTEDYLGNGYRKERRALEFAEDLPARDLPEKDLPALGASAAERGERSFGFDTPPGELSPTGYPYGNGPLPLAEGDSLAAIGKEIGACRGCRLCEGRKKTVPGTGCENPVVVVVGEGPGHEEDIQGLPFVGPAGKLLDKMLASIELSRDTNAFIANVVKCRPPNNRDPAPDEESACAGYLIRQLALLAPKFILTVGRIPTQALLGTKDPIGRLRNRWFQFRGIPLIATYHPSALLRDEGLKRPAWEDLKSLRERILKESRG